MNRKLTGGLLMITLLSLTLTLQRSDFAYADEQPSSRVASTFNGLEQQGGGLFIQSIPTELQCISSDTVLLIQDVIPWAREDLSDPDDLGANVAELTDQQKPFCMIHSEDIGSTDLSQFKEIIISAAQNQTFYDNLFSGLGDTIDPDLEDWVEDGGILSANLADCASNEADDPEDEPPVFVAGGIWADPVEDCANDTIDSFTFLGGVEHVIAFDGTGFAEDNSITAPINAIITGAFGGANGGTIVDVDPQIDIDGWFFSSHGYFTNLPPGTTIILTRPDLTSDDIPEPVMIQYPFGSGLVIASLITAEWRYVGGFLNIADPGDPPDIIHPFDQNKKILANEIGFQDALTQTCILREEQPEDPISMNTVRNKNIAKTIHAEKQIFDCVLEQGNIPVIVDVTIIGEIFEDMDTKSTLKKQAQVITCTKDKVDGTVLGCEATTPSTNPAIPMKNCGEFLIQHPQEMNTVNKGNIVKTVESQKEVFLCNIGSGAFKKVDIVLFTEIWENLNNPSNAIIKIEFEEMRCVINIGEAQVETCRFLNVLN